MKHFSGVLGIYLVDGGNQDNEKDIGRTGARARFPTPPCKLPRSRGTSFARTGIDPHLIPDKGGMP